MKPKNFNYWRFVPVVALIALAGLTLHSALGGRPLGWLDDIPWVLIICFLLFFLLFVSIIDLLQKRHTLQRNYPLIGRFRWLSEFMRPFIHSYFIEGEKEGTPFDREQRALVYRRAKDIEGVEAFGSDVDFKAPRLEWVAHSISAVEPDFGVSGRMVGEAQCKKPYHISLFNISAMSYGALGSHAISALNLGAKLGGFAHNTGEGGISRYHRKYGGDLIWEIGSGYFGCRNKDGNFDREAFAAQAQDDQIKMIEIKLSQGAKPGHGGILPGVKVTEPIAEARGVPIGEDCISPPFHRAFSTPVEMMEFISELRDKSGGKPIGIKLCVGQPAEVFALAKAMAYTKMHPDFITVDGSEGGTGAAPVEFLNSIGSPLREGLVLVRDAITGVNLQDRVKIACAGKIVSGADICFNLALGASWCYSGRGFMFSLGCIQSKICHTNHCPTGVATTQRNRQRGLVVEDKARRVMRFQMNTVHAAQETAAAAGCATPYDLAARHIRRRCTDGEVRGFSRIYPRLEPGILLEDPAVRFMAEPGNGR